MLIRHARSLVFALAGLAALAAAPAAAQIADAVIEVVVLDQSEQIVPGATVTISRPETGFTQTLVSDQTGLVRLPAVPPGNYTAKVELSGFATVEQPLVVRVGQTARITLVLKPAGVEEAVTVVGTAALVDVFKVDSSTNIVPEQIESLPVQDRDFQKLAFLAPGVQRERGGFRFIGGGPVIGAGGNASQSTILVDGVDFTDPVLGLARARFSQDAIGEFRVVTNRFDTEIGGSAGGAMSIVTKSGTNTFKGSAFAFFRDEALRSLREFETTKADYGRQQFGFALGGPIVTNKTHFFASVEQIGEDNTVLFRPGGAYAGLASDPKVPVDQTLVYGGIDHQINSSQNLRTKLVYERYRQENFRVGALADEASGMRLDRDNVNFTATHGWTRGQHVNQLAFQVGRRKFDEPNNSQKVAEYFSSGNTYITGANIVGDQTDTGDIIELRDTFFTRVGAGRWAADLKMGGSWQHVKDTWNFPVYPQDLMIYATDSPLLPLLYVDASGSGESTISTNLIAGFAQADLRPSPRVTVNLGLRYDLDTNGNNPEYTSPMMAEARGKDTNNFQPRAGFSWDVTGAGAHVVRGGAGLFTGRFLLVPSHSELQQNGYSGRIIQQRLNGLLIGLPALTLNPANPTATGLALPRDLTRLDSEFVSPHATQVTGGYTVRLGNTGLFADFEGIYVKGDDEIIVRDTNWKGNATPGRVNPAWNQMNTYTNEGRSEYKAFVSSVNGTIKGGHLITASFTVADKKNINDDFSPALVDYPDDPANIEAEWGRSRADERYRFVASAVLKLPYRFQVAPIFDYGSGQPWNPRRGYDYNGDGKSSDRMPGEGRFSEDGPNFMTLNLRVMHRLPIRDRAGIEFIAEVFNLFNRDNFDVNTVNSGHYLSGPTLANPALPANPNPKFGTYNATLPSLEAQLGIRFTF